MFIGMHLVVTVDTIVNFKGVHSVGAVRVADHTVIVAILVAVELFGGNHVQAPYLFYNRRWIYFATWFHLCAQFRILRKFTLLL